MVSRTYLEWMTSLPWSKSSGARNRHPQGAGYPQRRSYDLQKVKERILDYLAVKNFSRA